MTLTSQKRSDDFLKISSQFKLGALVTEASHPVTANLSDVAAKDIAAALRLLFEADGDVVKKFRTFVESGKAMAIHETVLRSLKDGGRIFFTGCGSTGRLGILLDSVWRDFWRRTRANADSVAGGRPGVREERALPAEIEDRTFSVMAGGDFALIKSVEGFEDFTEFGKRQIADLGVSSKDVVFAITEGGETSFVIGTAWQGVEAGAKVYFVYNNPDEILREHVQRSREVIDEPRIEKINLTTGPMSITGSTRMQATSIQLCVMLTILEMAARELTGGGDPAAVPDEFLSALERAYAALNSAAVLNSLAELVALEEAAYRSGHKNNYFADRFGIDVLTDTTERSPTYCTPPFRKFDDTTASESWAFLFLPERESARAWESLLKRAPRCVEWSEADVRGLVGGEKFARTMETVRKISRAELMRFKIGLDGLPYRQLKDGDCAVAVLSQAEKDSIAQPNGFFRSQLEAAQRAGAKTAWIYFGTAAMDGLPFAAKSVYVPVPETGLLLDGVTRVAVKLVMNALSTCTMVRLGRVMGNTMIWLVPSNLKLIDRSTRYISRLTGLDYLRANQLLFEVIEYVEPRMKSDRAYPPVVGVSVLRAKEHLTNEEAEKRLNVP
jgi:N-acetylmuramic acid 6-phosphate etherase